MGDDDKMAEHPHKNRAYKKRSGVPRDDKLALTSPSADRGHRGKKGVHAHVARMSLEPRGRGTLGSPTEHLKLSGHDPSRSTFVSELSPRPHLCPGPEIKSHLGERRENRTLPNESNETAPDPPPDGSDPEHFKGTTHLVSRPFDGGMGSDNDRKHPRQNGDADTTHAPSVNGPETIEVTVFADTTCCVKSDAKIAGTGVDATELLRGAKAAVDTREKDADTNNVEVAAAFGGTFGAINSDVLDPAKNRAREVNDVGKSARVTRVGLLAFGKSGASVGKKVARHFGPEEHSADCAEIDEPAVVDGNVTIVKGVGALAEPGSKTAERSRGEVEV